MKKVKCVIWDLDNTLWNGTLLEDSNVKLVHNVKDIIRELDNRGILQSLVSKNDYELAMSKVKEFGLEDYFLYPQINWGPKSNSVKKIAESINIGTDTIAFVDDQEFERKEVNFHHPEVNCYDSNEIDTLLDRPEMNPLFVTEDSKLRRQMYLNDIKRNKIEESFEGPNEDFQASLNMKLILSKATDGDLERAEELTQRTSQLNTTGYTYTYDELKNFMNSENYMMLIAKLDDKFGTYGKIGLALVQCTPSKWTIKLLIMSCRVMSRGVGTIVLNYIINRSIEEGVELNAEFVSTERNRMMYLTYKLANFKEVSKNGNYSVLRCEQLSKLPYPNYIDITFIKKSING